MACPAAMSAAASGGLVGPGALGSKAGALASTAFLAPACLVHPDGLPGAGPPAGKAGLGSLVVLASFLAVLLPFLLRWAPQALAAEQAVFRVRDLLLQRRPMDPVQAEALEAAGALGCEEALLLEGAAAERRWKAGAGDEVFQASVLARCRAAAWTPATPR